MAPTPLLGPPPKPAAAARPTEPTGDDFIDQMMSDFNSTTITAADEPLMGWTDNGSPTLLSAGNPCTDLFFQVAPNTPAESVKDYLRKAWDHDALKTLKLICNLRGVRGTGKSDKEGFYVAALWLHGTHPKTLACNIGTLASFGYFKDLPEILFRILEGADVRQKQRIEWQSRKGVKLSSKLIGGRSSRGRGGLRGGRGGGRGKRGGSTMSNRIRPKSVRSAKYRAATREARVSLAIKRGRMNKEKARQAREEKKMAKANKVVMHYRHDPEFRYLYERISDFFAERLRSDLQLLNSGERKKISLAAKWCPSLDSAFDKSTLLCESIARKIFSGESYPEYEGVEEAHYAYRVRDRLRKEVLVPLRKALELPEVFIGANQWGSLPYNRVASVAMHNYKEKFLKHDKVRFEGYLEQVEAGMAKIAAGARLPHELIASLNEADDGQVAELQWKRMVDDLGKKGKLKNCLAICDVSDKMAGAPLEVSVALGLLISELSEEPWKGKLITFSENPRLISIQGEDLLFKSDFVRDIDCGANTNFQKVFDLILQVAVNRKLKEDQMIKKVFLFSHMEFDVASGYNVGRHHGGGRGYVAPDSPPRYGGYGSEPPHTHRWETDYQAITRKFTEKGYGSCVPEIVFWNLKNSKATPVPGYQQGVSLVSGYSKNLVTLFLEEAGILNPDMVVDAAISGEEYNNLVVLD
ncbi:hypothetical protein RJ639_004476 [Escallonia herrerae]|uniref:Uncharacterized protein n=1 Tax=Escallonia herrerae TaxID=1293975 RepID=A0AA89B0Q7_9ASTE|nr:hypothetical protein RJ639_004476 [Escallonia herrerae]